MIFISMISNKKIKIYIYIYIYLTLIKKINTINISLNKNNIKTSIFISI